MVAALPNTEFFTSHWIAVVGIAILFFLLQLVLAARFGRLVRRQDAALRRLLRDFQQGGDGRGSGRGLPHHFAWLGWVIGNFPASPAAAPASFTRDDVLQELDTRTASNSDYLLLQRLGIMAPLLGVVLTVVGFFWLDVDEAQAQSLQSILLAVTPLVSGVGAGAVLALINQALLHSAGRRVESLRMSARTWFDAVIWRRIDGKSDTAAFKAVRSIERFTNSMDAAAERHSVATGRIDKSAAVIENAASQFSRVIASLGGEIKGMPQALADVRKATAATASALEQLIQTGSRAVANLDVSVAAFRTTLDRDYATAAQLQYRSSKVLSDSVEKIASATQQLHSNLQVDVVGRSVERLTDSTNSMSESRAALDGMLQQCSQLSSQFSAAHEQLVRMANGLAETEKLVRRSVETSVGPSQKTLREAADSFAASAAKLSHFIDQGLAPATSQLTTLHHTLAGLEQTVESIKNFSSMREDVDRLTHTLGRAAEISDAIAALPSQLKELIAESAAQAAPASANGGLRRWLARRPR